MPSCAARGCRSRPENGIRLFKLPGDPNRRQIWLEKMEREGDKVASSAKLCEMHFLDDQFENKRQDGKKFLRWNAIPTEFNFGVKKVERKLSRLRKQPKRSSKLKAHTTSKESTQKETNAIRPSAPHPPAPSEHTYAAAFSSQPSSLRVEDHARTDKDGNDRSDAGCCSSAQITEPAAQTAVASDDASTGDADDAYLPGFQKPPPISSVPAGDPAFLKLRNDYERLHRRHLALRKSNVKLSRQLMGMKNRAQVIEQKLETFLSKDQITKLGQKSTRGSLWSRSSIMSALKLKFSCGNLGYSALLGTNYPLPSARTLNRRLQTFAFESGLLHEAFDMLKVKVDHMSDKERLCCLTLVEVPIMPGIQHDKSTNAPIGAVTLPEHMGTATKGLIFMLGGIASHWKQTVAYHLIDDTTNGAVYQPIVIEIVEKAHSIGLHVCSVTSDMDVPSMAMWSAFGVGATCAEVINRIIHPCNPQEFLYFCPDVPHLLKGIWSALLRNRVAYLSPEHTSGFALPSGEISIEHLHQVVVLQICRELKMAPSLTEEALSTECFEKTKADRAVRLVNRDISATMRCMMEYHGWPGTMETTAWFLDFIHDWFKHMTSKHPVLALSKLSIEQYMQALAFLRSVMDVFQALRFGQAGTWEPVQSAILMATATILQIQEDLLEQHHFSYVLTARFSQDVAENEFSGLRSEVQALPALLFKQRLSSLAVSQYLITTQRASAESDPDTPKLLRNSKKSKRNHQEDHVSSDIQDIGGIDWAQVSMSVEAFNAISTLINLPSVSSPIDDIDKWCLYSLGGYVINTMKKKHAFCKKCMAQVASEKGEGIDPKIHRLVELKQFRDGRLAFPTSRAFVLLCKAEEMFRVQRIAFKGQQNLLRHVLELTLKRSEDITFLNCHEVKHKFLDEFLLVRQKISGKYMLTNSRQYHSDQQIFGQL